MNGLAVSVGELVKIISGGRGLRGKADLMVCPPATLIARFAEVGRGEVGEHAGELADRRAGGGDDYCISQFEFLL